MNVGVFLEDFAADEGGGYTIQGDIFHWLLELVDQSKHTFVVFCRRPEDLRGLLKSERIRAVAFPGSLSDRVLSRANRRVAAMREKRPQHSRFEQMAHDNAVEFVWFLGAEAVQIDLPYLAIVWDLQHRLQPWFPEVSADGGWDHREEFYSRFLRRAALIIAGTKAGSQEIQRFYEIPEDRIKLLPHPTPTFALGHSEAEQAGRAEFLSSHGLTKNYLFYPAQFWSHKNHVGLLHALRILKDDYQLEMPLVFVGSDKGNQNHVRKVAEELGLTSQVHFLGFVSQLELVTLYTNAFALTYSSFFGPENLPPLEAFALGCPVIAANVSGAEEQLCDAALLFDPRSPEQIAKAVKLLHDDPQLRRELVEKGKQRATKWTGREFVAQVFSILDEFELVRRCWA